MRANHDMLRPEFPGVNHKRVYRLYSEANLAVRRRKKVKRPASERVPLQLAQNVNEVWSMDFVSDSLANGRRIKFLTVADDFSHECVDITVDWGISGLYVTRLLDRAAPSAATRALCAQTTAQSSPAARLWRGPTPTAFAIS
jgi:putative transposase